MNEKKKWEILRNCGKKKCRGKFWWRVVLDPSRELHC